MLLKVRYKAFLQVLCMWCHIKMTKRGGRSYDHAGIKGTSPGELAVLCPACPIPSVNLPPNWQSAVKDSEYVDVLHKPPLLTQSIAGTCTTKHLASTPASSSRGGRFLAMRRIRSWVQGLRTLFCGVRIASTSVTLPINRRFVWCILWHPNLTDVYGKTDEHM